MVRNNNNKLGGFWVFMEGWLVCIACQTVEKAITQKVKRKEREREKRERELWRRRHSHSQPSQSQSQSQSHFHTIYDYSFPLFFSYNSPFGLNPPNTTRFGHPGLPPQTTRFDRPRSCYCSSSAPSRMDLID